MPFTLAHPAAVLPLRRWCPGRLDFAALVVGSITPDLAASIDDWEYFSHTILGSFLFCLPVGLLTFWMFHAIREAVVLSLPNPHRGALLPLCVEAPKPFVRIMISLLLGSWIHIIWDLFTHDHSWLVKHTLLSAKLGGVPLNQMVWFISSAGGVVLVLAAYISLLRKSGLRLWTFSSSDRPAYILWCILVALPLAGAVLAVFYEIKFRYFYFNIYFLRHVAMFYLSGLYLTLILVGFILKSRVPKESHQTA